MIGTQNIATTNVIISNTKEEIGISIVIEDDMMMGPIITVIPVNDVVKKEEETETSLDCVPTTTAATVVITIAVACPLQHLVLP